MQGACLRSQSDLHPVSHIENITFISWPTVAEDCKSGIAISVNAKYFKKDAIRQIYDPPPHLLGRVGAVRVQTGSLCLCVCSLYFRPSPGLPAARATALQICA